MMDIKEIALKLSYEMQLATELVMGDYNKGVTAFAQALVAEIKRQSEPVAWVSRESDSGDIAIDSKDSAATEHWSASFPVYEFPPDKAQIEQRVAEACAEWCENRMAQYEAGGFVREFSAARTAVNAIRSGEWKKFRKGE